MNIRLRSPFLAFGLFSILAISLMNCSSSQRRPAGVGSPIATTAGANPILTEAQSLLQIIEVNYGPLRLKEQTVGLKWDELKQSFLSEVQSAKSSGEVYLAILKLFSSLKDAHVQVQIPSTFKAEFPFQFVAIGQKVLLNYKGDADFKAANCEVAQGDELVSLANRPIDDILNRIAPFVHVGNIRSTRALWVYLLTQWSEQNGLAQWLKKDGNGKLIGEFEFKSRKSGALVKCVIPATTDGVPLFNYPIHTDMSDAELAEIAKQELSRVAQWVSSKKSVAAGKDDFDSAGFKFSASEKNHLELIGHAIDLQNQIANLRTGGQISSPTPAQDDEEDALVERGGFRIAQKKPYFKLPKSFHHIGGFGSGLPIVGSPFPRSAGFYAGTFKHEGKKVGYLRIPEYEPKGKTKTMTAGLNIRYLLGRLEKHSDFLIIDQTHNPGGAVMLTDWLVDSLVGEFDPNKHLKFAVRPRGDWLAQFADLSVTLKKIEELEIESSKDPQKNEPSTLNSYLKNQYLKEFEDEYIKVYSAHSKQDFLTPPISLFSTSAYLRDSIDSVFKKFYKNKSHLSFAGDILEVLFPLQASKSFKRGRIYSKPVYMMIDELDFSGGDATPAILQDYGRVKLVGVNTAGAGGTVEDFQTQGMFPVNFSLTTSLMVRSGGRTVENVGVKPDISFELTEQDVVENYENVLSRLLKTIGE